MSGTLDLKALAAAVGGKRAEMAEPADAERATGYVVGGISPLGPPQPARRRGRRDGDRAGPGLRLGRPARPAGVAGAGRPGARSPGRGWRRSAARAEPRRSSAIGAGRGTAAVAPARPGRRRRPVGVVATRVSPATMAKNVMTAASARRAARRSQRSAAARRSARRPGPPGPRLGDLRRAQQQADAPGHHGAEQAAGGQADQRQPSRPSRSSSTAATATRTPASPAQTANQPSAATAVSAAADRDTRRRRSFS